LATREKHRLDFFVTDNIPGNQETAIGIIHQIGPLGARPPAIKRALSAMRLAVNIGINVWATLQGWLNAKAWGSTAVLVLLLLGGLYELSQRLFDERS